MRPTSPGAISFDIKDQMPYSQMIRGINYGLIIHSVLGMATQNSKNGEYSLTVGEGLVVKDGKIQGVLDNAVIAGNLFDALRDEKTRFARYRKDKLAMKISASVTGKD